MRRNPSSHPFNRVICYAQRDCDIPKGFHVTFAFCIFLEIKWQQHVSFFMIIAIRFFCAGQAEISLKAEGNNPQPCLNRCRGIRHEGFSSELSVTEALQIIYIISVSLPSQDRGSFYDFVYLLPLKHI